MRLASSAVANSPFEPITLSTTLNSDDLRIDANRPDAGKPADLPPAIPQRIGDRIVFRTEDLFHDTREIWFEHGNDQYRLRITAAGKLILTK